MGKKHRPAKRAERLSSGSASASGEDGSTPPAKAARAPAASNPAKSKSPKSKSKAKFGYDYSKDYKDPNWPYAKGGMDKGAWLIIILTPLVVFSAVGYYRYMDYMREMVRTPLDAPKMISLTATSALEDPSRFWGTYRSGLYFGMKTRTPHSPVMGLMWMPQFTGEMPPQIRHWCEQGDGLALYSWFAHDGRNFGIQEIVDKYYTVNTDFVKRPGGDHGGDWTARIAVKPRPGAEKVAMSLFFYTALDPDSKGKVEAEVHQNGMRFMHGYTEELGRFKLSFPKAANIKKTNYLVAYSPTHSVLKEVMMQSMRPMPWGADNLQYLGLGGRMVPHDVGGPNFVVHQVTVTLPFQMEVVFESESFVDRPDTLAGEVYQASLTHHLSAFDAKFENIFKLKKKGFPTEQIGYAKAALSNMLGGIGYFYGSSLVKSDYVKEGTLDYWKAPLYTGVPSRSFFPRGFLWDEGFHNILINKWDQEISMDIIGHWLDLMNADGWIPREQILGNEASAKVPKEFVVQHNKNANPPTLFLPLQNIVKKLIHSEDPRDKTYLKHLFPRLKTWFSWFNVTQAGPVPTSYRWRGRDTETKRELNPKTLTSGLDDYPRASHPSDIERHVDLRCWMALASGVMADIAKSIGEPADQYIATHEQLTDNALLDSLHWSEKSQRYSDYGLHSDRLKLERPPNKPLAPGQRPPPPREMERMEKEPPRHQFVDSFGYVSLFPFLLKIVQPDSPKLGKILLDLKDPNLLWTKYGIRSLAKSAPLYSKHNTEHDPPYWRGAIWINMNYLTVRALHHYANTQGPYAGLAKELYTDLRTNLVSNIIGQFKASGFIWEQYEDKTGKGKGCHPFTGWSALVVAVMAEEYD